MTEMIKKWRSLGLVVIVLALVVALGIFGGGQLWRGVYAEGRGVVAPIGGSGIQPGTILNPGTGAGKVVPAALSGTGAAGQVTFWTGTESLSGDNGLYWDNTNKRLGIGTTTPSRLLHLKGNICLFERNVNSAGFIIDRTGVASANRWVFGADEPTGFVIKTYPVDGGAAVEQLVITKDDPATGANESKVGIGVTSPTYKLQVETVSGEAVYGKNTTSTNYGYLGGASYGVYGRDSGGNYGYLADSQYGVYGYGSVSGVYGACISGSGVYGSSTNSNGVYGTSSSLYGVHGKYGTGGPYGYLGSVDNGVYGETSNGTGAGVSGKHTGSGPSVYGINTSSNNAGLLGGTLYGAKGSNTAGHWGALGTGTAGVQGQDVSGTQIGKLGTPTEGVFGQAPLIPPPPQPPIPPPWAGNFQGNVVINGALEVTGPIFKGAGAFSIDHPLDPEHKRLQHSFVESPDMKNVYDGNAVLDDEGEAVVELPSYFEALNRDFRYQLTCIGGYAPVYIAEKVKDNRFKIAGGSAGLEVSWQVTGIRHDPFAQAHPIQVEVEKPGN